MEFKKYKLSKLFTEFHAGKNIKANFISNSGNYPVFGGNGIRGFTESFNQDGCYVIIGRQGAYCGNVRYNIGKAFLTEHAIVGQPSILGNAIYLAYKLSMLNLSQYQGQSAQPGLSVETLSNIEIAIPSKQSQENIAKLLQSLDNKIALNCQINAKLEQMTKRLYDHWFVQFDFPNTDGKPYKASGGKMIWNETLKHEIPDGWKVKKLGELFTTNRGVSYSTKTITGDAGIPMINLASFSPDGSYKIDGIKLYTGEYTQEKVLRPFDLVMCNTQQTAINFPKDIIGKALLVPDIFEGDITSSHHVNTLKVKNEKLKFYLYRLFNTDYFHAYISHFASGTNIMGLDFSGVENYTAVIPSDEILSKFADFTLNIEKKKSEIIRENKKLISLRDRLLPLLMNGQVEVK